VSVSAPQPALQVSHLSVSYPNDNGGLQALVDLSFDVHAHEFICILGPSGSGKTTLLRVLAGLLPPTSGEVRFMADRLPLIGYVFQSANLMPWRTVVENITLPLELVAQPRSQAVSRAKEMVELVGLAGFEDTLPRDLSGGMAQRVMIAMALACEPELLIADEPTTALDVTIQAQILDLMRGLQRDLGTAIVLITHDLGIVAEMCSRVAVMYAGEIVEQADVRTLFDQPKHPYTQGLISSVPKLGEVKTDLDVIPGGVPNLVDLPPGSRFAPRCRARVENGLAICLERRPDLKEVEPGHEVRCWLYEPGIERHPPGDVPATLPPA